MSEFKVGDKVKCVSNKHIDGKKESNVKIGKVYKVEEGLFEDMRIEIECCLYLSLNENTKFMFELVEEEIDPIIQTILNHYDLQLYEEFNYERVGGNTKYRFTEKRLEVYSRTHDHWTGTSFYFENGVKKLPFVPTEETEEFYTIAPQWKDGYVANYKQNVTNEEWAIRIERLKKRGVKCYRTKEEVKKEVERLGW